VALLPLHGELAGTFEVDREVAMRASEIAVAGPIRQWCRPCKDRGRLAIADVDVEGTPMCDACFRDVPSKGVPIGLVVLHRKEKPMPKRIDDQTRAAIRKDAADGMNLNQIAAKHSVGWGTARDIVATAAHKIPRIERGGKPAKKRNQIIPSPNGAAIIMPSDGLANLKPTPAMLDALWSALPLEKKIGFLNFIYAGTQLAGGG
jgi:hypothetical protein